MPDHMPHIILVGVLVVVLGCGVAFASGPTFEERVRAQAEIERVYHTHRDGETRAFDAVYADEFLEQTVRDYLARSMMLENRWHVHLTADDLEREYRRMVRGTKIPERLSEMVVALDHDPRLVLECLARRTLVRRLTQERFTRDRSIHAAQRRRAESLRRALVEGKTVPAETRRTETLLTGAEFALEE